MRTMILRRPSPKAIAPIERPVCPKCKTQMMLARLMPGREGFELQSFDCPKCNHELTIEAADPLRAAQGSLCGELHPPE
jgi:transposase-like protein